MYEITSALPCVVALNQFNSDTDEGILFLKRKIGHHGVPVVVCNHWSQGSQGALELARDSSKYN